MPKPSQPSGLSAKMERFVAEYLVDGNGKRSAIAAGYSPRSAMRQASDMLQHPAVKKALTAGRRRIAKKLELSAEKVLGDIERIANAAEKAKKYGDALKGKELLGKHLKLFTEKHEHGGIGGGPVQFSITEKEADL